MERSGWAALSAPDCRRKAAALRPNEGCGNAGCICYGYRADVLSEKTGCGDTDRDSGVRLQVWAFRYYDGNEFDDMMEYMSVCDIMISDYSAAVYDWTLVNKPGFLYAHDRDEYENHGRGLYHTMDFYPYSFADSFEELIENIGAFDEKAFEQDRQVFLDRIGNVEDGNASARAVELIKKNITAKIK